MMGKIIVSRRGVNAIPDVDHTYLYSYQRLTAISAGDTLHHVQDLKITLLWVKMHRWHQHYFKITGGANWPLIIASFFFISWAVICFIAALFAAVGERSK